MFNVNLPTPNGRQQQETLTEWPFHKIDKTMSDIINIMSTDDLWPLLLAWINFNPSMDK